MLEPLREPDHHCVARVVCRSFMQTLVCFLNNAGQPGGDRDAFWICFALVEREAKTVYARSVARSTVGDVDIAPAASHADSPVWGLDAATRAYIEACQRSQPGTPVSPAYLDQLGAAARIREAGAAYEAGDHRRARDLYREAQAQPGGDQLRVLNGLYLSYAALGETGAADETFGQMVERGFSLGRLGVKFLFEPNSTAFNADRKLSASYPAWLREIAMRATRAGPPMPEPTSSTRESDVSPSASIRCSVEATPPACSWSTPLRSSTRSRSTSTPASRSAPSTRPSRSPPL